MAARKAGEISERQRLEELYVARMVAIQRAVESNDIRRADQLLVSLEPQPGQPDLRGFEWYYWRQQSRRGLLWELGPFRRLESVVVSPDGKWLAFGGQEGIVRWRNLDGSELSEEPVVGPDDLPQRVYSLAFSPDSRWLAVGTAGTAVLVIEVADHKRVRQLECEGGWVRAVEFSRDGKLLAAGLHEGGNVELWTDLDPATHRVIHVTEHAVRSLAMSRDGKRIATFSAPYLGAEKRTELRLLDVDTGQILGRKDESTTRGWGIQFTSDHRSLLNPNQSASVIDILDLPGLESNDAVSYRGDPSISTITLSPDGNVLVGGGKNGELLGWNVDHPHVSATWPGHFDQVMAISIFPDGEKMVSCGYDGFVKCWSMKSSHDTRLLTGLPAGVRWLQFSPDGVSFYVAGYDPQGMFLQARAADSGAPLWQVYEHNSMLVNACLAPDGHMLVVGMAAGEVRFIDAGSGKLIDDRREHRQNRMIRASCISPNGQWLATADGPEFAPAVTGSRTEEIVLWDLQRRSVVCRWPAHDRLVGLMLFGPGDNELVTYGWDKCIRRWRIPDGKLMAEYPMEMKIATGLAFADEQKTLVAVDTDGRIWRWSLRNGEQAPVIRAREGLARTTQVYASDQTLLIPFGTENVTDLAQRGSVEFIDMRTWEGKLTLDACPSAVTAVAMSPDGSTLLAGDALGNVHQWHVDRAAGGN